MRLLGWGADVDEGGPELAALGACRAAVGLTKAWPSDNQHLPRGSLSQRFPSPPPRGLGQRETGFISLVDKCRIGSLTWTGFLH